MRLFLIIALVGLSSTPSARAQRASRAGRCAEKCRGYLEKSGERVFRCQACLTDPSDGGGWLLSLTAVPPGAKDDEAWDVRWGALRLEAKLAHLAPERRLGQWVASASGAERERACLTAVHVAGSAGLTLAQLLAPARTLDPSAAPACVALTSALRRSLEPAFFSLDELEARDALEHTARALEVPVARLLLDALGSRAAPAEVSVAEALRGWAARHDTAAGRALLAVATQADAAPMNRLLAVYARDRDAQRPLLSSPDPTERAAAIEVLAALAPLSAPELAQALEDPSPRLRLDAAVALARGEGVTLLQAGAARVSSPAGAVPLTEQLTWLSLLAQSNTRGCASLALETSAAPLAMLQLRAAALEAAADCDFSLARPELLAALSGPGLDLRAAALRALARGPADDFFEAQVAAGLQADDERVVAAAVYGAGRQRLRRHLRTLEGLATSASPLVRLEVLRALTVLSPGLARVRAVRSLSVDGSEEVRAAAAQSLGVLGGNLARAALEGARNDTSATVKFVAGDSLHRLGY